MSPSLAKQQILIGGLPVSYYKTDTPGTQSVVFLHGWRSEGGVWQDIMQNLDAPSYALDMPGFGQSATPPQPFTVSGYADVVAAFIKKLELQNVCLVGHSFGGRVGIKLAAEHPEIVQKLVLVDAAGFRDDSAGLKLKKSAARAVKPLFKLPGLKQLRPKIYKMIGAEDYTATPQLRETFVNLINEDLSPYLSKISQPTLIIWGGQDKVTPLDFARRMQGAIRASELTILKGAGHFSFLDQPQQFADALKTFLSL